MEDREKNPLEQIFNARSIAVFGANEKLTTMGTYQLMNLLGIGFPGKVYPVHPKLASIQGLKAYGSVADLPEVPDLALITIKSEAVVKLFEELGRKGVKRAIVISGGFKEMGEQGRALEQELVKVAQRYGIRFVGPNCIGIIAPWAKINVTMYPYRMNPGAIGLASHSGTYVTQSLVYLEKFGIGYSKAVSLGNEASIDLVDAIDYYAADEQVKAIALYIEGIRRPAEFLAAAKRASAKKPVVAIYVGGTKAGARSGASHTGAMAGRDEIYDGAFKQAGIIRAPDLQSLFEWAYTLAYQPRLKGNRIAVCTNAGGPATSLADALERAGFEVPEFSANLQAKIREQLPPTGSSKNPVDMTYAPDLEIPFFKLPQLILESGEVDGLIIHGIGGGSWYDQLSHNQQEAIKFPFEEMKKWIDAIFLKLAKLPQEIGKPIVTSSFVGREDSAVASVQDLGMPCLPTPERTVLAMAQLRPSK